MNGNIWEYLRYNGYTNQIKHIIVHEGINNITERSFENTELLQDITLPSTLLIIKSFSFFSSGLKAVTIPSNVRTIQSLAFFNCTSLKTVSIPASVSTIGPGAFAGCNAITSFSIASSNGYYKYDSTSKSILSKDGKKFVAYIGNSKDVVVPSTVTSIEPFAFAGKLVSNVTLNNKIKVISDFAFKNCENLEFIQGIDSVEVIGSSAFYGCKSLKDFRMGPFVKTIKGSAFEGSGLVSLTMTNNVTSIGDSCFARCSSLSNIYLSNRLVTIGANCFHECNSLTSVTIPDSVQQIGSWAFASLKNLNSVVLSNSLKTIGDSSFAASGLKSLKMPEGVQTVGEWAFAGCVQLETLTIAKNISVINKEAFAGCNKLRKVRFSGLVDPNVSSTRLFYKCPELTCVTVPMEYESESFCGLSVCRVEDVSASDVSESDSGLAHLSVGYNHFPSLLFIVFVLVAAFCIVF